MAKRTIRDLNLNGRRVFIRVDYNVPLKKGVIGDDTRIRETIPTIEYALNAGAARVVLASHLGRPKGAPNPEMSLRPVAVRLSDLIQRKVTFAEDCVGPRPKTQSAALRREAWCSSKTFASMRKKRRTTADSPNGWRRSPTPT